MIPNKVCAIIVSFRPSHQLTGNVAAIIDQVDHLVIVDNGSTGTSVDLLRDIDASPRIDVIFNSSNEGIATALNQGLRWALEKGYRWMVTFDQDSTATPGLIETLWKSFSDAPEVAIAAPSYIDRELGTRLGENREKNGEVRTVLTSGMLIPSWVFEHVGFMNEALFIDSVDHEFCHRTRAAGYRIVQREDALLLHSLGRLTTFRFLGRRFEATNHSAGRKYYQTRNRLWTLGRPRLDIVWWEEAFKEIKIIGWDTCKIALVEEDKLKKMFRVVQGGLDAVAGRMGKRVEL